ncbi:Protein of unknown function [Faunimonas pinastri]|uniref:Uncharacterized protein n=1 Tax=Faunimonas pinastri TaxID=1855383 RepID=A0A1H9QMD5_9HYPH|nr:Protein of unknown function [Faunimonas pinastri]
MPTRRDADRIFREAMAVCGVDPVTRWIMWLGVRVGAQLPGQARNSRFD